MNNIDEQTVLTARFAYRMLVTVCLGALIFVYSPQKQSVFKGAVNEINTLLELNTKHLLTETVTRNEKVSSYVQNVQNILSDYDLKLSTDFFSNNLIKIKPDLSRYMSSLEIINEHFTSISELSISIIEIDNAFEQSLRKALTERKIEVKKLGRNVRIGIESNNGVKQFMICTEKRGCFGFPIDGIPKSKKFTIQYNILNEFSKKTQYRHLVGRVNEDLLFLPNLKSVWNQIRSEGLTQARAILARQDAPKERNLEVFGLSIPQYLISWIIPTIMCAISVFFFVHLNYLRIVIFKNPALQDYPWVVLIPGRLAFFVAITTILIFPAITLLSTVISTWESGGILLRMLSVGASIGALSTLIISFSTLITIRSNKANSADAKSRAAD